MADQKDALDPRGLISEAFRIEGIVEADCRSIFFDWALGLGAEQDPPAAIEALIARHADQPADHPMRLVLLEGLNRRAGVQAGATGPDAPGRRRGGRRARISE